MFDRDHWQEIAHALGSNKLRTALTAFGVFWGLFMLMLMIGSGNGLENGVTSDFGDSAKNSFFVWTQSTSKPYRGLPAGRRFEFENSDIEALRSGVPELGVIAPRNQLGGFRTGNNVTRGTKSGGFNVMGDYPEIRHIESFRMVEGRFLNRLDLEERRKIAVIGTRVQEMLFEPDEDPIGESIRVQGISFKVVGVFDSTRGGDDADRDTQTVFIPFSTFQNAFNAVNLVDWFALTPVDGLPASVAEEKTKAFLRARHRVAPDDQRALGSWNTEEEYLQIQGLFGGIRALVWIVGIGTLAAGVIGVSNIMLVIVRERTKEIGIRRALGATPLAIMRQVVTESVLLTSIAGYLGLVAGIALTEGVAWALRSSGGSVDMFMNPTVQVGNAVQALGILIVAGVLAGVMPARRAVRVPPVDALRME